MQESLISAFRKHRRRVGRLKTQVSEGREVIHFDQLHDVMDFWGFARHNLRNCGGIRVRGQTRNHKGMVPYLFRGAQSDHEVSERYKVYRRLVVETKRAFPNMKRFQTEIGPLLQHYGIKTPWLDVLESIYPAIWFATRKPANSKKSRPSTEEYGWLYFIAAQVDSQELEFSDLRADHSSLSLRLHCQHGAAVSRKGEGARSGFSWTLSNADLNPFVVATVRFPNNERWNLSGRLFEQCELFPSARRDHTYGQLVSHRFAALLASIDEPRCLGEIDRFGAVSGRS